MTAPRPGRAPGRGRWVDERGSASVQMVVLLPVVFAVMFLGLQAALYYHARTVAIAAAEEGAHAAAAETGTTGDGAAAAGAFVEAAGGDNVLAGPTITATRTPATVTVTVSGRPLSVIPGWTLRVRQSATVPTERLTTG